MGTANHRGTRCGASNSLRGAFRVIVPIALATLVGLSSSGCESPKRKKAGPESIDALSGDRGKRSKAGRPEFGIAVEPPTGGSVGDDGVILLSVSSDSDVQRDIDFSGFSPTSVTVSPDLPSGLRVGMSGGKARLMGKLTGTVDSAKSYTVTAKGGGKTAKKSIKLSGQ